MTQPDNHTPSGVPSPAVDPVPPPAPEVAPVVSPGTTFLPPGVAPRPVSAQEFRDALTGREPTMQALPPSSLTGREPTMGAAAGSAVPGLTGREPTMQALPSSSPSLTGREPTMQELPPSLTGREQTMGAAAAPVLPGLTGREMTIQELPLQVTGRERTITDTPATMAAAGKPPTDAARKTPTDPARRTPTDLANSAVRKPMTLGAGRSPTGTGTSANFDDAWHLQGRKGPFTGHTWDDFDLGGILGEGGMGAVYRAKQRSLYRRVAIKVLPPNLAADARLLERFLLEARSASTMQSPHIVQVYAIGEHDGNHYFAMEFVEGTDLYEVIRARKEAANPITADEAADYILQSAKGLAEASRHGIVHRDIKPPNLMVTRKDNLVKIADFGIVKVMGEHNLTMTGQAVGTPAYVSPEQGRGDREIDQRSDLYSLGVVFYELLCGKKPFEGTTPSALIYQHCYDEPMLPQKINPSITDEYQAVVLKCLQKKPENRYQSAEELITDLQAIKTGAMLKSALANYKGTGADEARREQMNWIQRNLLKVALAAGVVVLGGGSLAYWQISRSNDAKLAVDRERRALEVLDRIAPIPKDIDEAGLARFEQLNGGSDDQILRWKAKLARVRDLEGQLAPVDQKVTAALRATAPRLRDELMTLVGKDAPNVVRWTKILKDKDDQDKELRGKLATMDTMGLTKTTRDQLKPLLDELQELAPAGDAKVKGWVALVDEFDRTLAALMTQLAPLDQVKGGIPQERIDAYTTALALVRPKLGDGDRRYVQWKKTIEDAQGSIGKVRKAIGEQMPKEGRPSRTVQMQVQADLTILESLAGAEDSDVKRWKGAIIAANLSIETLRKQLGEAFAPLAADDILPVGQIKPMADCLQALAALELPGVPEVIRWDKRIRDSEAQARKLSEQLTRLDPSHAEPIPLAEQKSLAEALTRLRDKGGVDLGRDQLCRERLAAEAERVANLRRRLAESLDAAKPYTPVVRQDLERVLVDAGGADPQVVTWRRKAAAIEELVSKLKPLGEDNTVVPPGCQDLYHQLRDLVGKDDAMVLAYAPRYQQVQEVESALAALDRAVPLPKDVAANLERSERLFGKEDPVHVRRTGKVALVARLKERLQRLAAVVAEPAVTLAEDRAAFERLIAQVGVTDADVPAYARRLAELMGPGRPAWASAQGRDEYGLWVDLAVRGQTQRWRYCPPGQVVLGSPDDEAGRRADEVPVRVAISHAFWMAESECTQAQWTALMGANPSRRQGAGRPVERVSLEEIQHFVDLTNGTVSGLKARLPSEAEWEYASRAGSQKPWSVAQGAEVQADKVAWFAGNSGGETHEVKLRFPNPLGLYDLHGNVWEWCLDRYGAYPTSAVSDWIGRDGLLGVVRGGSWGDGGAATRSANRQPARPDLHSAYVGFRLVAEVAWTAEPDGSGLIASAGGAKRRFELPIGNGSLAIEWVLPEDGAPAVDAGKGTP